MVRGYEKTEWDDDDDGGEEDDVEVGKEHSCRDCTHTGWHQEMKMLDRTYCTNHRQSSWS